jgi:hypothetical protein
MEGERYIECEPYEPSCYEDSDGKKFYTSVRVNDLDVGISNSVKITLDVSDDDNKNQI